MPTVSFSGQRATAQHERVVLDVLTHLRDSLALQNASEALQQLASEPIPPCEEPLLGDRVARRDERERLNELPGVEGEDLDPGEARPQVPV